MQIYLFRHGQTAGHAFGKFLGVTDEPLCELGVETAKAAGSDPTVQEVMVTTLQRTQMTAAILFPNAKQRICPSLREMNFGDFEGRSADEMSDDPDFRWWVEQTQCLGPCPHGEARLVFQHRVCAAFRREVERARAAGQEKLYFVIHGGTVMSVLDRFSRPHGSYYSWHLKNCQGFRCEAAWGPEGLELTDMVLLDRVDP